MTKLYNGKPMSHWQAEADKLVADILIRGLNHCDPLSIIGRLARPQIEKFMNQMDKSVIDSVMDERDRCVRGFCAIMSDILDNPKKHKTMHMTVKAVSIGKAK